VVARERALRYRLHIANGKCRIGQANRIVLRVGNTGGAWVGKKGIGAVDLRQTPLAEIAARCRDETARFLRKEETEDAFCYEIFRRAIVERDAAAWEAVYAQYRGVVLAWVRRHPMAVASDEDDAYWVNRAFDRFWGAVGPERFAAFPTMAALLRYLKLCAHSSLMDTVRASHAARFEPLSEQAAEASEEPDTADTVVDTLAGGDLWAAIQAEMQDDGERHVAYCCFALDLKPREIYERRPDLFATVDDIYRIKRNLLDRLRRSPKIRAFLG
jgi:hypothetical protein